MRQLIREEEYNKFQEELAKKMKSILIDGFMPGTPIFIYVKIGEFLKIAKRHGISLTFEDCDNHERLFKRFPWLFNYKVLRFLNSLYNIRLYINRYTTVHGFKFYVKPAKKMWEITMDYRLLDIWEPETTKIVEEHVKEGQTCIDIGASQGYFTLLFSRCVGPTGHVVAVEPTDFQQPYLLKNIKNNGYKDRVEVWNVGAWDKTETIAMPRNAPKYVQTLAPCMAVDDIVDGRKIDFIKLDCDGPEPKVLQGLVKTFRDNPNLQMVVEYYPKYIEDAGLYTADFRRIIDKYFEFEIIPGDYTAGCWNLFCKRNDHAKNDWSTMYEG